MWVFRGLSTLCLALLLSSPAFAGTVVLSPTQDNTLYEDPVGGLSNGAGEHLFAGRTGSAGVRRGMVRFDLAGRVPRGATVLGVTLTLNVSKLPPDPETVNMRLLRITRSWGEGDSDAGSPGGQGTSADAGDATWIHAFHPTELWSSAGGDVASTVSATSSVAGTGPVSWGSTPQMVADVQSWIDSPGENFGWQIRGNEGVPHTARRFDSRENPDPAVRPRLVLQFVGPSGPPTIPTLSWWSVATLATVLALAGLRLVRPGGG